MAAARGAGWGGKEACGVIWLVGVRLPACGLVWFGLVRLGPGEGNGTRSEERRVGKECSW